LFAFWIYTGERPMRRRSHRDSSQRYCFGALELPTLRRATVVPHFGFIYQRKEGEMVLGVVRSEQRQRWDCGGSKIPTGTPLTLTSPVLGAYLRFRAFFIFAFVAHFFRFCFKIWIFYKVREQAVMTFTVCIKCVYKTTNRGVVALPPRG
jgi:hypothetical protein